MGRRQQWLCKKSIVLEKECNYLDTLRYKITKPPVVNRKFRHSAYALVLMFTMGTVVAPFSHYMFMMVSDAYHVGSHHDTEHMGHGEHHGTHTIAHDVKYSGESVEHLSCDYWSLFATYSATEPITQQAIPAPEPSSVQVEAEFSAPATKKHRRYSLRGPPAPILS